MPTAAPPALPLVIGDVEVTGVRRLSPSFVRLELGGPVLAEFGVDGPLLDQRIKLVLPAPGGPPPSLAGADESWYASWLDLPVGERGHMRTYTVSSSYGAGVDTRILVDVVLHPGAQGPGSVWAAQARPGDRCCVIAPRRGHAFGGIEFVPGEAGHLLLAADETAVPAVGGILAGLPTEARGAAFLEVPGHADMLDLPVRDGVSVTWLPRNGAAHGTRLLPAVLDHLGGGSVLAQTASDEAVEVDPDLWETPSYSSSGDSLDPPGPGLDGLYAWIAGESTMVTQLRRSLVGDVGLHRRQVAFMGYWRHGVAMRS